MKKLLFAAVLAALALSCGKQEKVGGEYGYTVKDNKIVYNTPPRPADQQSMLGFAAEPIEHVRIGLVGLGDRGSGAEGVFTWETTGLAPGRYTLHHETLDATGGVIANIERYEIRRFCLINFFA